MYCRTNPPHPKANSKGLYPLHRVVAENKIGRPLVRGEDVHHKDENKANDDADNLDVLTKSAHAKLHKPARDLVEVVCGCCSGTFRLKRHVVKQREKRSATGNVYCSRACTMKATAFK